MKFCMHLSTRIQDKRNEPALIKCLTDLALEAGLDAGPVVAAITRRSGAPVLRAFVPGPRPLLRWLLERRFVIDDLDTFMATEPSAVPDQLAVVHPGLA